MFGRITTNSLEKRDDLLIIEDSRKEFVRISGKLIGETAYRSRITNGELVGVLEKIPVKSGKLVRLTDEGLDILRGILKSGDGK